MIYTRKDIALDKVYHDGKLTWWYVRTVQENGFLHVGKITYCHQSGVFTQYDRDDELVGNYSQLDYAFNFLVDLFLQRQNA